MSIRTPELSDLIVEGLTNGIPLRELCRDNGISKSEFYRWEDDDAELKGRVARARKKGYEHIADECCDIADNGTNDWMARREAREGQPDQVTFNAEHVQRSKLRVETRLKLLACWDPRRYGNKTEHTGPGGGPLQVAAVDLSGATAEQLRVLAGLNLGEKP